MLKVSDMLQAHQQLFATLAEAWLASGAVSFSIWEDGQQRACWPPHPPASAALLALPIVPDAPGMAEVRVAGLGGAAAQRRLQSDAALIARLLLQERELEHMTMALVECRDQMLALYDLNQATRSHLEIDQTLISLAHAAARLVNVAGAWTLLLQDGKPHVQHYPAPLLEEAAMLDYVQMMQSAGCEVVLHAETTPGVLPPTIHNLCLVPVQVQQSTIAALGLVNKVGGFTSPDVKLVRAIAEQAGAQIENVLLHQETLQRTRLQTEMDLARRVQLRLLPQSLPPVAGVDIAAESRPALQVGGDFYDVLAQPGTPCRLVLGDVAGKGMAAALMMTVTLTMIRSKVKSRPEMLPDALLNQLNQELYDDFTDVGMFATTFLGHYEPASRTLTCSSAGHAPVIYCPAGGRARLLEADGVAIGVLPANFCRSYTLTIHPGDVLVVATDGFSEAHNSQREMFGTERLLQHITVLPPDTPAQHIAAHLFAAVAHFSGERLQDDDQTIIVVRGGA